MLQKGADPAIEDNFGVTAAEAAQKTGKTAIVEGLAQKMIVGGVPYILRDRRLVALDMISLVAGTKYRGQFEERIKAVMDEIKRANVPHEIFLTNLIGNHILMAVHPPLLYLGYVGMAVPWARARVGAIATQAMTNESFGPNGLELLAKGKTAPEALADLIAADSDPEARQLATRIVAVCAFHGVQLLRLEDLRWARHSNPAGCLHLLLQCDAQRDRPHHQHQGLSVGLTDQA